MSLRGGKPAKAKSEALSRIARCKIDKILSILNETLILSIINKAFTFF